MPSPALLPRIPLPLDQLDQQQGEPLDLEVAPFHHSRPASTPPPLLHQAERKDHPLTELVTRRLAKDSRERGARAGRRELKRPRAGKRKREEKLKVIESGTAGGEITPGFLESGVDQVVAALTRGCDCGLDCLKCLEPDFVLGHRTNIAKLSRAEHDMYLMGIIMATMGNPKSTSKRKERQRVRNKYIFQGREVCLEAFLYLENVTAYHVKAIRAHVLEKGVIPRSMRATDPKKDRKLGSHHSQALSYIKKILEEEGGISDRLSLDWLHQLYCSKFEKDRTDLLELNTFKRWVVKRVPGLAKELNRDPTILPPGLKTDTVLSLDMNSL